MIGCVCVIWDSCRKQGSWGGGGGSGGLVQCIFLWLWKKGECPNTWLAQWADSSLNDVTTQWLTYLNWLWCHSCLVHSASLSPCPHSPSLTQLQSITVLKSLISLCPFLRCLFFLFIIFLYLHFAKQTHKHRQLRQICEKSPILEIKVALMNINVLESSSGPGDMTKRGGKLPPYG